MSSDEALQIQINRMRKRVRVLLVEKYALYGMSCGALVAAVMVLLSTRFTELIDYWLWACTVLIGLLAGGVIGLIWRFEDISVAIAADKRTGLKERVSTAYAIQRTELHDVDKALIQDATEHISNYSSRDIFRHRFGRPHLILGISLLLLLIAIVVPQMDAFQSKDRLQEKAALKVEGKNMVKVAKEINRDAAGKKELRRLAAKLEQLGKKMQTGRMERKTAMLKAQQLSKELQREQDRLAKANSETKTMEQAQAEMKKSSMELASTMAEKLAKAQKIPLDAAMKKVPSDKRLAELMRKAEPLTKSEKAELESALQKYADPKNQTPIPSELGEALAKLAQNGDYQKAMEILQKLTQKMNSGKLSQMDKEMLRKHLEALAKALKNTDLNKLAEQMKKNAEQLAKMSPEELKKLMKEIDSQKMAKGDIDKACLACLLGREMGMGLAASRGFGPKGANHPNQPEGAPRKLQEAKGAVKMPTQVGESGMVFSAGETTGAPDPHAATKVPYTAVLPEAKRAAESALSKDKVPPAFRKRVKDYFGTLE